MDKSINLFIAESHIGNHASAIPLLSEEIGQTELLSFTFRPSFKNLDDEIISPSQVNIPISNKNALHYSKKNNYEVFKIMKENNYDIVDFIMHEVKDGVIFLGHDADASGALMSNLLYWHLIYRGFEPEKIIRIPLLEYGYESINIGVSYDLYLPEDELAYILDLIRLEQVMMHKFGTKLGFRNMEALRILYEDKPQYVERKNMGTSTATYVTKFLLGEEY